MKSIVFGSFFPSQKHDFGSKNACLFPLRKTFVLEKKRQKPFGVNDLRVGFRNFTTLSLYEISS